MIQARLLVLDDEPNSVDRITGLLQRSRVAIQAVHSGDDAVDSAVAAKEQGQPFDVILMEYRLLGTANVDVLKCLTQHEVDSRVILMAGQRPSEVAVESMNLGAFDFISKPLEQGELEMRIERALRDRRVTPSTEEQSEPVRKLRKSDVIIGRSAGIKELYERISMVAPTDVTVAISGESGTGKELVARTIHNLSKRYQRPFVVVNCAAIPENLLEDELFGHVRGSFTDARQDRQGLFAAADTGTLFLDEIGEMPLSLQVKVLRVLQSQEFRRLGDDRPTRVDVRIITATNRNLEKAVTSGAFRQDLYYRINVFPIVLPPLRDRRDDIPLLAHHFLLALRGKVGKRVDGFAAGALAKLQSYDFPGNVRELENKVHHALVMAHGTLIQPEDVSLPSDMTASAHPVDLSRTFRDLKREVIETFERQYVCELLRVHQGNIAAASRQAGMDRKNFWVLTKKYEIDPNGFRTG